eukprot:49318-Rhodomonas_salina.2
MSDCFETHARSYPPRLFSTLPDSISALIIAKSHVKGHVSPMNCTEIALLVFDIAKPRPYISRPARTRYARSGADTACAATRLVLVTEGVRIGRMRWGEVTYRAMDQLCDV